MMEQKVSFETLSSHPLPEFMSLIKTDCLEKNKSTLGTMYPHKNVLSYLHCLNCKSITFNSITAMGVGIQTR